LEYKCSNTGVTLKKKLMV